MPKIGWKPSEETRAKWRAAWERDRETRLATLASSAWPAAAHANRKRWAGLTESEKALIVSRLSAAGVSGIKRNGRTVSPSYRAALARHLADPAVVVKRKAALSRRDVIDRRNKAISRAAVGRRLSQQTRMKLSERARAQWADPVKRARCLTSRASGWDNEARERARVRALAQWSNLETRDKFLRAWDKRTSSLERIVKSTLDALSISYVAQKQIGHFVVDMFIPSRDLVIECDGEYWHSRPGRPEQDAVRDQVLLGMGYRVLRLSERDIKTGAHVASLKAEAA